MFANLAASATFQATVLRPGVEVRDCGQGLEGRLGEPEALEQADARGLQRRLNSASVSTPSATQCQARALWSITSQDHLTGPARVDAADKLDVELDEIRLEVAAHDQAPHGGAGEVVDCGREPADLLMDDGAQMIDMPDCLVLREPVPSSLRTEMPPCARR